MKRLLLILSMVLCLFISGFWINGQITLNAQDNLPDPSGEMIDIGDHALHIYCIGEGSPTVILETGSGVLSLSWYPLQEQIAEFTRVCTYDRAGYGWSDPSQTPRTALQVAHELDRLLTNAGIETPVILAGHSMGGMFARYFAATHPDLVAGVVLVDATPPMFSSVVRMEIAGVDAFFQGEAAGYDEFIEFVRSGAWTSQNAENMVPPGLPVELVETYSQLMSQPAAIEAMYAEYIAFDYNMEQTRAAGDLGDIPLIVLAGRNAPFPEAWAEDAWQRWVEFQEEQASISTNSRFEALDSGHYIYVELPDVVLEAIRELIESTSSE